MFKELVKKTRSYRRFRPDPAPSLEQLEELVALARLAPSASNLQPLKYGLITGAAEREKVFSCLTWAGYLPDWPGPEEEERPTAYFLLMSDPKINKEPLLDLGLAAQIILLGAQKQGFGGCLLGSVDRPKLQGLLDLPQHLKLHLVLALGTPLEQVELRTVAENGDVRYWRDENQIHYVPKRPLKDLIVAKF